MKTNTSYLHIPLFDINQKETTLSKYLGNYIVLYFYPKDDTPGCTKEACSFRDAYEEFKQLNAVVIGISKDSIKSHQKFISKYSLNFELLSDPEHKLQEELGVWQKKKFMGKEYMGTARTTFLLSPTGEIIKRYDNVKPDGHGSKVLDDLKAL